MQFDSRSWTADGSLQRVSALGLTGDQLARRHGRMLGVDVLMQQPVNRYR